MANNPPSPPPLAPYLHQVGPDGIVRENPVIAYTERVIEAEQLQLRRYIQENYSKIRDVERELENLQLELKLTAGPKKAALEHLRKKIELSTERIHAAKAKEEQAKKVWEAAVQLVKDEEATKKQLCDDLNQLVQESASKQITRLEELKRRLEALNPSRVSNDVSDVKSPHQIHAAASQPTTHHEASGQAPQEPLTTNSPNNNSAQAASNSQQQPSDMREKKKMLNLARGRANNAIRPKGREPTGPGWTGAGFDVDGRS